MTSFLLGTDGAVHVTGPDGTTSLVPGIPIVGLAPPAQALAAGLVTDADSVLAPAIAAAGVSSLLPAPVADAETAYTPAVGTTAAVLPALYTDADTIYSIPSVTADAPGHGRQTLRPDPISDAETIFASAIGASLKPNLVASDDLIYPIPSITAASRTQLVPSDDVIYQLGVTLFLKPSLVAGDDVIAHADVGWHLFVNAPVIDVDAVHVPFAQAWAYVLPDVLVEDDNLQTYPFYIHGLTGGIPVPEKPHLVGSVNRKIHLTGSVKKQIHLTGSVGNKRRLTGSLRSVNYYGKAPKKR